MALSVQERRKEVSNLLKNEKLKNSELAERLHVSVSTIASDKKALQAEKKNTNNKKNTIADKQKHDTTENHVNHVDNDINDHIDKIIVDGRDAVDDGIAKAQKVINDASAESRRALVNETDGNDAKPPHVEEQHNPVEHVVETKPVIKNESHEKLFNNSEQYNRATDLIIGFASGVIAFAIIMMIFG